VIPLQLAYLTNTLTPGKTAQVIYMGSTTGVYCPQFDSSAPGRQPKIPSTCDSVSNLRTMMAFVAPVSARTDRETDFGKAEFTQQDVTTISPANQLLEVCPPPDHLPRSADLARRDHPEQQEHAAVACNESAIECQVHHPG